MGCRHVRHIPGSRWCLLRRGCQLAQEFRPDVRVGSGLRCAKGVHWSHQDSWNAFHVFRKDTFFFFFFSISSLEFLQRNRTWLETGQMSAPTASLVEPFGTWSTTRPSTSGVVALAGAIEQPTWPDLKGDAWPEERGCDPTNGFHMISSFDFWAVCNIGWSSTTYLFFVLFSYFVDDISWFRSSRLSLGMQLSVHFERTSLCLGLSSPEADVTSDWTDFSSFWMPCGTETRFSLRMNIDFQKNALVFWICVHDLARWWDANVECDLRNTFGKLAPTLDKNLAQLTIDVQSNLIATMPPSQPGSLEFSSVLPGCSCVVSKASCVDHRRQLLRACGGAWSGEPLLGDHHRCQGTAGGSWVLHGFTMASKWTQLWPGVFRIYSRSLACLCEAQALGCLDLHTAASHRGGHFVPKMLHLTPFDPTTLGLEDGPF